MSFERDEPEFCLEHGYEHMRKHSPFDKFSFCAACEAGMDDDARVVACDFCQTEGRVLTNDGGPYDSDHGPCPCCEGTGNNLVAVTSVGVYGEWCRDPAACAGKGYCPHDPTCGD